MNANRARMERDGLNGLECIRITFLVHADWSSQANCSWVDLSISGTAVGDGGKRLGPSGSFDQAMIRPVRSSTGMCRGTPPTTVSSVAPGDSPFKSNQQTSAPRWL